MTEEPAIILFDGVCNLCNASVNFVIDHDPHRRFRFAALQSAAGQKLLHQYALPAQLDTIILIDSGTYYERSSAVLRIAKRLTGFWSLLYPLLLIPKSFRDRIYSVVAGRRYRWFGKAEACRVPTPDLQERFL